MLFIYGRYSNAIFLWQLLRIIDFSPSAEPSDSPLTGKVIAKHFRQIEASSPERVRPRGRINVGQPLRLSGVARAASITAVLSFFSVEIQPLY